MCYFKNFRHPQQIKSLYLLLSFESFLIAWALMQLTRVGTRHLLTALFFLMGLLLTVTVSHRVACQSPTASTRRSALGMSLLFTFFYVCGDFEGICEELTNRMFRLAVLLVTAIGLLILFYKVLLLLFLFMRNHTLTTGYAKSRANRMSHFHFGLFAFLICLICWLPYFLKSFPGVLTVDSMNQYAQIIGIYGQSNHHPWVHTQIIKLFYQLGLLFTPDPSKAIAFYTVAQLCFMAFCVAYLMQYLHRFQLKTWVYALVLGFYGLVPYNGAYAISMVKDTIFAGCILLYTLSLFTLLQETSKAAGTFEHIAVSGHEKPVSATLTLKRSRPTLLLMLVSGVFLSLFRSNGFYAFLFMIPFVLFCFRRNWKLMLPAQLGILVIVLLVKGPVMTACGVTQPDLVESLSIPGQQISRVLMQERELTEEQSQFLNQIMDTSRMAEGYNPHVSDWFKRLVRMKNPEYLSEHFDEFLKVYVQLGLKYPGDYLLAYRDQTIGYWFPLSDQPEIALNEGVCENEFGLQTEALLKGSLVVKINEILFKLHHIVPGYGLLWSVGALFWIILICMCATGLYRDKHRMLLYLPAVAIFLTLMVATPVGKDFRYAYGYVYNFPLYLILAGLEKTDCN